MIATLAWILGAGIVGAAPPGAAPAEAVAVMPSGAEISLEIAADPAARARGYMHREHVGEAEGMLFVFDRSGNHGIWMKNCRVPLDIIWMDEDFRVVEVARDRPPCPSDGECPTMVPVRRARYVLEVAGGKAAEHGVRRGSRIRILSDPPVFR